jgi:hypothetical protein
MADGTNLDWDFGSSPNVFTVGGRTLVGIGQKNGFYHAFDATTGQILWQHQLSYAEHNGGSASTGGLIPTCAWPAGMRVTSSTWVVAFLDWTPARYIARYDILRSYVYWWTRTFILFRCRDRATRDAASIAVLLHKKSEGNAEQAKCSVC